MQFNSIEAIKIAVRLGLGVAFIPSVTIEQEVELEMVGILKIDNVSINRTLLIINNSNSHRSKAFEYFYKELLILQDNLEN